MQCGVVSDLEDESLAGITLFGNLLSFPEMGQNQQMLAELYRCVSPGGFCVLQLPDIKKWQRMHPACTEEFALHHETSNGLVTEEGRRTFDADSYVSSGNFVYKDSHDTPLMEYSTTNQLFDLHDSRHGFSIEMMLRRAGFGLVAADPGPVACSPRARGLMSCMINIIGIK